MITSGLIIGLVALLFTLGGTLVFPLCTPILALLLGTVSGFLAPQFEKLDQKKPAVRRGAYAGAISGIGAFLGQIIGAVINSITVGPEGVANIMRSLGLPMASGVDVVAGYWAGVVGSTLCLSVLNVLIMAGMGAVGGLLWWGLIGSKKSSTVK